MALLNGALAYRDYYHDKKRDPALTRTIGAVYTGISKTVQSFIDSHKETYRQARRELSCILEPQKH